MAPFGGAVVLKNVEMGQHVGHGEKVLQVKLERWRARIALLLSRLEYLCRIHICPRVELVDRAPLFMISK